MVGSLESGGGAVDAAIVGEVVVSEGAVDTPETTRQLSSL